LLGALDELVGALAERGPKVEDVMRQRFLVGLVLAAALAVPAAALARARQETVGTLMLRSHNQRQPDEKYRATVISVFGPDSTSVRFDNGLRDR
jgi:hypothetical protein